MELTFHPITHEYRVDGRKVPSVSELTRFLHREVSGTVPARAMRCAAERGTAVHKALNELEQNGTVQADSDCAPYLKAYLEFLQAHNVIILGMDCRVHRGYDYAGTFDRLALLDGRRVIFEFTTASLVGPRQLVWYGAGLNLYRLAASEALGPVEGICLLQLKRNGTYKLFELPADSGPAEACLCLHRALTAPGERRNAHVRS